MRSGWVFFESSFALSPPSLSAYKFGCLLPAFCLMISSRDSSCLVTAITRLLLFDEGGRFRPRYSGLRISSVGFAGSGGRSSSGGSEIIGILEPGRLDLLEPVCGLEPDDGGVSLDREYLLSTGRKSDARESLDFCVDKTPGRPPKVQAPKAASASVTSLRALGLSFLSNGSRSSSSSSSSEEVRQRTLDSLRFEFPKALLLPPVFFDAVDILLRELLLLSNSHDCREFWTFRVIELAGVGVAIGSDVLLPFVIDGMPIDSWSTVEDL